MMPFRHSESKPYLSRDVPENPAAEKYFQRDTASPNEPTDENIVGRSKGFQ
jgi:hypothetical protein